MVNAVQFEKLAKYGFNEIICDDMQFAFVAKTTAQKGCKCALCTKAIEKGEERVSTVTAKDTKHAHEECMKKVWEDTTACDTDTQQSNYNASTTNNHEMVVRASKWLIVAFIELGFVVKACSPTHKNYILDNEKNRHRSGHIVKTLTNLFKVFINGQQVTDFDTFDSITRK